MKKIALFFGFFLFASLPFASYAHASTGMPQAPNSAISNNISRNWSGYVARNGTYTSVQGTWVIPQVSATTSVAADATWVGIGGISSDDLIQAGTQAIIENGTTQYQAWYELLPNSSIPVSLTVNPGDTINTSLNETSQNNWLIQITDATTGQSYSTTVNYASSNSSAEWIEEMPSDDVNFIPLDNFGSISFSNASTINNGVSENLSEANAEAVTMTTADESAALSIPSAIGSDGASFTVTRTQASSSVAPHEVSLGRRGFTRGPGPMEVLTSGNPNTVQILRYVLTPGTTKTQTFTSGPFTIQFSFTSN